MESFAPMFVQLPRHHQQSRDHVVPSVVPVDLDEFEGMLPSPPAACPSLNEVLDADTFYNKMLSEISGALEAPATHATRKQLPPPPSPPQSSAPGSPGSVSSADGSGGELQPGELPPWLGPLPDSFWDLNELQVASLSFKDFSKLCDRSKLTQRQVTEAKKLRRRVKNRFSAQKCVTVKRAKADRTEIENTRLRRQVLDLTAANDNLLNQHMMLQEQMIETQKAKEELQREKLFLRAEVDRVNKLLAMVTAGAGAGHPEGGLAGVDLEHDIFAEAA